VSYKKNLSPNNEFIYRHYAKCNKTNTNFHRFIFRLRPIKDEEIIVDHLNHNGLDNRRCNLNLCLGYINKINETIRIDNKSGIPCLNNKYGLMWVTCSKLSKLGVPNHYKEFKYNGPDQFKTKFIEATRA